MKKLFEGFKSIRKPLVMCMVVMFVVASMSVSVFAAEGEMGSMTTVLTTAFSEMIAEMLAAVTAILPITLTLVGCSIVIAFGIKWFKKIIGHA